MITASMLYDFVQCPHRLHLDIHGDQAQRDKESAFVMMLWDQGLSFEREVAGKLNITADLSGLPADEAERATLEAMDRNEPLIYQGRISADGLVGVPDLLARSGGGYIPGDIKSGSGFEGDEEEGKLKKHYAYQTAHYVNILEKLGRADGTRNAFIIDRTGEMVTYPLAEPQGVRNPQSLWDGYQAALAQVRTLVDGGSSRAALSALCKQCCWGTHCKKTLIEADDITLIPELGRSRRDKLAEAIPTVRDLSAIDPESFIQGKKTAFPGVGPDSLRNFHARARLLVTPGAVPYLKKAVALPAQPMEVFFDIEAHPMRDVVYLHGFVERRRGDPASARFIPFFAEGITAGDEEQAFAGAWAYLMSVAGQAAIYYYSAYEKTSYRKLAGKFDAVCSREDVDALFSSPNMIDLYQVIKSCTEWPTNDHSIKTLAQHLGFRWRNKNPSGAASIEWFENYSKTRDPKLKEDIIEYNEDDCLATGVVVDGLRKLGAT